MLQESTGLDVEARVVRFLLDEAAALNEERYEDWLGLITEDFDYRMPAPCVHDDPRKPRYDEDALLAWESANSLRLRFERIGSEFAWADRPPPLHRRHITGARLVLSGNGSHGALDYVVRSDVLIARSRRPDGTSVVSAGREDVIRDIGGVLQLARRTVYIDVDMPNVSQISIIF